MMWLAAVGGCGALCAVAVAAFKLMTVISRRRHQLTDSEVAQAIEVFLSQAGQPWDWDEFLTRPIADPELDQVRVRCARSPVEFPTDRKGEYCSDAGYRELENMARALRARSRRIS